MTIAVTARYVAPPYHPRHDKHFKARVLADLLEHAGDYRQLGRLLAPDCPSWDRCCAVRDAVVYHRRHGYEIVGDRQQGYKLVSGQLSLVGELA